jgi:hypothetical protein
VRLLLLSLLLALLPAACVRGQGTRCERVCRAEADCAERLALDSDTNGCIEACAELERDPATQRLVEEHMRCVNTALTCTALLECP